MKTTNNKNIIHFLSLFLLLVFIQETTLAQQLAFPGAEGFGRYTTGGRLGEVYHVTNLNDAGAGSFRDAVSKSNRTIVFDVGGVIKITDRIVVHSNITIAGQTAPGGGITIYGNGIAFNDDSGNNIIRYIRIRMGKNGDSGKDAVGISAGQNYIFDHVSISWGRDGTLDVNGTGIDNLSFQDCIIGQGINNSNHSTGGLMQSGKWSMIRSLYIDNKTRNPKARVQHEFINSVLYNWGTNGYIMGDSDGTSECNLLGNYFIYGPSSGSNTHITGTTPTFFVYANDNWVDSDKDGVLDGYLLTDYKTATIKNTAFNYPGVNNLMSAKEALNHIMNNAGASIVRDEVDKLLINQLSSYGKQGSLILTEDDNGIANNVGAVANGTPPIDTDQDGMPDQWENNFGMNPNVADQNGDNDGDGYTNIEEYLDWIVNAGTNTVSGISISPTNTTINVGATTQLSASVMPLNATNKNVSWTSANSSIATVSSTGLVSGAAEGSTTITVTTEEGGFTASCNISVTSATVPNTLTIQENETGFCSVDGSIDNNNSGFTGTGFANTNNASGEGITWSVNIPTAGTYSIVWRFANGGSSDRTGQLMVDGSTVASSVSMPSTGSWSNWTETTTVNLNLSAGTKLIRLQATNSSGLANVDYITLSGGSLSAVTCNGLKCVQSPVSLTDNDSELKINCYPNPVGDQLNIQFSRELTEEVGVYLYDMTGKLVKSSKAIGLKHSLNMSDLPNGIYTIKASRENMRINTSVVKQ